jgi:hypothetical protein
MPHRIALVISNPTDDQQDLLNRLARSKFFKGAMIQINPSTGDEVWVNQDEAREAGRRIGKVSLGSRAFFASSLQLEDKNGTRYKDERSIKAGLNPEIDLRAAVRYLDESGEGITPAQAQFLRGWLLEIDGLAEIESRD